MNVWLHLAWFFDINIRCRLRNSRTVLSTLADIVLAIMPKPPL
jgi:hypothetical protein